MNTNETSFLRAVIGFVGGGLSAALAAALVFLAFFPLPADPKPTDHTGEALIVLVVVVFFCGGLIGQRAFSADFWSDLLPDIVASYLLIGLLFLVSSLNLSETLPMIGFASIGLAASAVVMMLLGQRLR